jgi:2'-5' RNA ligase
MKRLFLASFAKLYEYDSIKKEFSDCFAGRWTSVENLHMTLYYFGSVEDVEKLIKDLKKLIYPFKEVELTGLNTFSRPPRVLYAKLKTDPFSKIYGQLQKKFHLDKRYFNPHVTLMRIKQTLNDQYRKKIHHYDDKIIGILENQISLVKSETTAQGPIYTKIHTF